LAKLRWICEVGELAWGRRKTRAVVAARASS
jgi:hypothetical protein